MVHYCIHIDPMLSCLNLLYNFAPSSLLTFSRFPGISFVDSSSRMPYVHLLWLVHVPLHLIALHEWGAASVV